jgi:carnitine 3-dehydrogenase
MATHIPVERIAIVGTGTIGASWAAHYLAHGFDVVATDPGPGAEEALRDYVERAWDTVSGLGLTPGASLDRLTFTPDLQEAVADADFVQEQAPERLDLKVKLFADIDAAAPVDAIIASSSSGIPMSDIQTGCKHPERTVIGHPFNPPHVIPLVEVVGGNATATETIDAAMAFYAAVGKRPIQLHKELPGHVANRLQSALYREVVYLIDQGVLDVAAADDAVSWGPGLRWGVMGPSLLWHLGGGEGGIEHFMDTLMDPMAGAWKTLGNPEMTPALKQKIIDGVLAEANGSSIDELSHSRDEMLLGLQTIRAEYEPAHAAPTNAA